MFNELNKDFVKLLESYYSTVKSKNSEIIDINEEELEHKIKIFGTLLEYYVQSLLYQNNIKLTEEEIKQINKSFDELIESYIALVISASNNSLKLKDTLLEYIVDKDIAKKLISEKHNNDEVLEEIFNKINEQITYYAQDIVRNEKQQIKEELLNERELAEPKKSLERLIVSKIFERFVNDLLLDKVNDFVIEEYIKKNSNDEIFESELIKQLEKLYENYKEKLDIFSKQLARVVVK